MIGVTSTFASQSMTNENVNVLSGTLGVVNKSDNSISIVDIETKKIIKTLPTGKGPHELVISPDGNWAVSTDFVGGDSLTVFDLQAQKVAGTISLPNMPGPHGIRFLQDNAQVVFTSGNSQRLGVANIHSKTVTNSIVTGQNTTHMVALSLDEKTAFTTNIGSNSISVLDLASGKKRKDIATQAMPEAIAYRTSAKELWYGANKEGLVMAINPETEDVLGRWEGFSFPYRILFNHEQTVAVVPDFRNHNVRFFDANTKQEIGLLQLEPKAGPQGIVLHPTKDIAFLSLNLKNKVVAINIKEQSIMAEYPTGYNPDGIIFID
jgi:YVTN family beta-propeller protein